MTSGTEVRDRSRKCIDLFRDCLSSPCLGTLKWVRTGQADFNLWAWGLNATSTGKASLDSRLRQRADILDVICDLLDGLVETLQDSLIQDSKALPTSSDQTIIDAFKDVEFDAKTILKQLSRIHVAIRRAGTKLRHQRADNTLEEALRDEELQGWKEDMENLLLVGMKMVHPIQATLEPLAPLEPSITPEPRSLGIVQQRLIHANLIRRHRIQVATETLRGARKRAAGQQLHEAEQEALPVEEQACEKTRHGTDEASADEKAKNTNNPMQHLNVGTISPHVEHEVASAKESEAQRTATEFPSDYRVDLTPSRKSATIITKATGTGRKQDYPRWPKKLESEEDIPCPYCAEPLSAEYVRNDGRWRGHLAGDLAPYVCVIQNCQAGDVLFVTTDDLNKHVRQEHGIQRWVCNYCADQLTANESAILDTVDDWVSHVQNFHFENMPSSQIRTLADLSMRTMIEEMECPLGTLCDFSRSTIQPEIDPHITDHMHQFALRALPWGISDKQSDSKSLNSGAKSEPDEEHLGPSPYDESNVGTLLDNLELDVESTQTILDNIYFTVTAQPLRPDLVTAIDALRLELRNATSADTSVVDLLRIYCTVFQLAAPGDTRCFSFTREMIEELETFVLDGIKVLRDRLGEYQSTSVRNSRDITILEDHSSTVPAGDHGSTATENAEDEDLSERLAKCMVRSSFDKTPHNFVPEGVLGRIITRNSILAAMGVATLTDEIGVLLDFILNRARKIFAISVLIGLDNKPLRRAMLMFMEHDFDDKNLPIEDGRSSSSMSDILHGRPSSQAQNVFNSIEPSFVSKPRIWKGGRIYRFCEQQWAFLAPIFSATESKHDFTSQTIIPFVWKQTGHDTGSFGRVNGYRIHPDHIKDARGPDGRDPAVFAVKEILFPDIKAGQEIAARWESEVKVLEKMNALDQNHIVRFITAFRRFHSDGEKERYLIFEWADGGNLRDLLEAYPRPSNPLMVKAIIKQLLGLAQALQAAHYRVDGASFRHGNLKPTNILWFRNGGEIGTLKIGNWGDPKMHVVEDVLHRNPTNNQYANRRYEAPEVETGVRSMNSRRSRLGDMWAMGCIFLDFVVWLLYGLKGLKEYDHGVTEELGGNSAFYQVDNRTGKPIARVHDAVERWMNHIADDSACQVGKTALGDLLELLRTGLLVVELPRRPDPYPLHINTHEAPSPDIPTIKITVEEPPKIEPAGPSRLSSTALVSRLKDILDKDDESYWYKAPSQSFPKASVESTLSVMQDEDHARSAEVRNDDFTPSGIAGSQLERVDYAHPKLDGNDWKFHLDNEFAYNLFTTLKSSSSLTVPDARVSTLLCEDCRVLRDELFRPGFSITYNVSVLRERYLLYDCDLCHLLWKHGEQYYDADLSIIRFERTGSTLTISGSALPVLSIFRSPDLDFEPANDCQIGFAKLPESHSATHFEILRQWLKHCDNNHAQSTCKPAKQTIELGTQEPKRMPTRLIDVGGIDDSEVRLRETSAIANTEWITLSHLWGSGAMDRRLTTTTYNFEQHLKGIRFDDLPPTFRDAVWVTRALGCRYLWIDALCIITDSNEDWQSSSMQMEEVFSGAYCVIAANRAHNMFAGFLGARDERESVSLCRKDGAPFYVSEMIDNFQSHVLGSQLCNRGWTLQEHALARRTIFFTDHQAYFECGDGVRCETMTKMSNYSAALLGDPNFPQILLDTPRTEGILRCQQLYTAYSRLLLTRVSDRPIAIEALERRLLQTMRFQGGFGVIGGETEGLLHRSLLWHRGNDVSSLSKISCSTSKNIPVPSWSWMAHNGGIDYFQIGYDEYEWENVGSVWSDERYAYLEHPTLTAVVRDYSLENANPNQVVLIFDNPKSVQLARTLCVVLGKQKGERLLGDKRHYVLIVALREGMTRAQMPVVERIGAGYLPGECITAAADIMVHIL